MDAPKPDWTERLLTGYRPWLLVAALGAVLTLPWLGSSGLWDPWEPHYAEVAREMVESGNWLEPTWEHTAAPGVTPDRKHFFSKPALSLWLMAISMLVRSPAGRPPQTRSRPTMAPKTAAAAILSAASQPTDPGLTSQSEFCPICHAHS